jgi:Cu+-exporting ATPase
MPVETKNKLIDPVCGREVSSDSKFHSFYGNGTYYFCSAQDKEEFDRQPEKYTKENTSFSSGGSCD